MNISKKILQYETRTRGSDGGGGGVPLLGRVQEEGGGQSDACMKVVDCFILVKKQRWQSGGRKRKS